MLPKEKAEELINKFMFADIYFSTKQGNKLNAKQCALICCDEMLNNAGFIWGGRDTEIGLSARDAFRKYWSEVKEELLKM